MMMSRRMCSVAIKQCSSSVLTRTVTVVRCGSFSTLARPSASLARGCSLTRSSQPQQILLLVRTTHNRNAPRPGRHDRSVTPTSEDGIPVPQAGPVFGSNNVGGLYDIHPDVKPHSAWGRVLYHVRVAGRVVVFGAIVAAMVGSALFIGVFYFANPQEEVRARATKILGTQPLAIQLLGKGIQDVTQRHMGARQLQAFHLFPYVGRHVVEMRFVLQGNRGRGQVHVQFMKDGKDWTPIYLAIETNKGNAVVLDHRQGEKKQLKR